jgi:hypothetical protein
MSRVGGLAWRALLALVVGLWLGACDESIFGPPEGAAVFEIEVSGEVFQAAVVDSAQIRLLEDRVQGQQRGVISGELLPGDGGFNAGWGWHWDPESVHVSDLAIELCDGRPSMVQADLPYWLGTVQQYCPWGARVVARKQ